MKIDLANIAGTPGARAGFEISERFGPAEGIPVAGPVTGEITVENTGSLLLVRGRLQAAVEMACARCLGGLQQTLEIEVEEEFAGEDAGPEVLTVDREEPEASAISDYVLDVHEFVRQQVAVAAPLAPVCRPDCQGVCPQCGQNLNLGPCGCVPERFPEGSPKGSDSRWAKLGELLGGQQQGANEAGPHPAGTAKRGQVQRSAIPRSPGECGDERAHPRR